MAEDIEVINVKENEDGSCEFTIVVSEEVRDAIMKVGILTIINDAVKKIQDEQAQTSEENIDESGC